jgi:hypothetical protein
MTSPDCPLTKKSAKQDLQRLLELSTMSNSCTENLPATQAGARHAGDAPWDSGRSHGRLTADGFFWTTEHSVY